MFRKFITTDEYRFNGKKHGYEAIYVLEDSDECKSLLKQHNDDCVIVMKDKYSSYVEPVDINDCDKLSYFGNCVEYETFEGQNEQGNKIFLRRFLGDLEGLTMIEVHFATNSQERKFKPDENWMEITRNNEYKLTSLYKKPLQEILGEINNSKAKQK